jgi:hypothetical protein
MFVEMYNLTVNVLAINSQANEDDSITTDAVALCVVLYLLLHSFF